MVYIKNIGKYIPENYLDNLSEAEFNGKDLNWLTNSIGILNTPKKKFQRDSFVNVYKCI